MKISRIRWLAVMCFLTVAAFDLFSVGSARSYLFRTFQAEAAADSAAPSETQKANLDAYAALLHEDVPDQKEQLMGLVLSLNQADADKFWPIYNRYEGELDKLNATSAASIDDYVRSYGHLTEQQADNVVHNQTRVQSQRAALLDKYYGEVEGALGPETAARFYEAESQLLLLTDLQLSSKLPVE
jgi:hypothetical protein